MRLYEHEGKAFFAKNKIPTSKGKVAATVEDAVTVAQEIGFPVIVKAQVLTGGRGKAGGVKLAKSEAEANEHAAKILGLVIKDYPVEKLLIEPALEIEREIYLGVTIDRAHYKLVLIGCAEGGVEIEETAKTSPDKIIKIAFEIDEPCYPYHGIQMAQRLGLGGDDLKAVSDIAVRLFHLFKKLDAKVVEINPLVRTKDGNWIAADARIALDDDALFRHPEFAEMGIGARHEVGELTPREKQAQEWGIPYVDLDGNIGMFPGGAGFGILGNDFIHHYGGKPANFMDSGGGPSPERIAKMLVLLDDNPQVKVIFGARFGGISRCDDFAKGVIQFLREHGLSKPMVVRMTGNKWEEGLRIVEEAKKETPDIFKNMEFHGIETPIEEISKRAVELAKTAK
ncbi:acetate--CoA ligase family protein [bacterium]|nr:acetate--CoA ligase family protein [bacterium]MBU1983515.1 acetate--CoA ligase family protein [bacterium]